MIRSAKPFKNTPSKQGGWTIWTMLFMVSFIFCSGYLVLKLIPIYSASSNLRNAMIVSVQDKDLQRISKRDVILNIQKQLMLDGALDMIDIKRDVKVSRTKNKFMLEANYEHEVSIVGNLFVVAKFNTVVACELNGRCDK